MLYSEFVRKIYKGELIVNRGDIYYLTNSRGHPDIRLVKIGVDYPEPPPGGYHQIHNIVFGKHEFLVIHRTSFFIQKYCFYDDDPDYYWFTPEDVKSNYYSTCRLRGDRYIRVYPNELLEIINFDETMKMNPFQIQGYHASGMRTNIDRVRSSDFLKLEDEPYGEIDTFLGLELELCGYSDQSMYDVDDFMAEPVNKDVFEHFDGSEDASLSGEGLELVSLPMTYNYILSKREMFDKIYTLVNDKNLTNKCGSMHIHFDTSFMSKVVMGNGYKLLNFVWDNLAKHKNKLNYIVGREGNSWCAFAPLYSPNLNTINRNHNRWVCNTGRTIEIRRYGSNFNTDDLFLKINFTMDIFKKVMELNKLPDADLELGYIILRQIIDNYYLQKVKIIEDFKKVSNDKNFWANMFRWWDELPEDREARKEE